MREVLGKVLVLAGWLLAFAVSQPAHAVERIRLSIGGVEHPAFAVRGVAFQYDAAGAPPQLSIEQLRLGNRSWNAVRLSCLRWVLTLDGMRCPKSELSVAGRRVPAVIGFSLKAAGAAFELFLDLPSGARLRLRHDGASRFEMSLERFPGEDVIRLASLLSPAVATEWARYALRGMIDVRLVWDRSGPASPQDRIVLHARIDDAAFSTPDGLQAAEGIRAALNGSAQAGRSGWDWQGQIAWGQGEAYLHPFYLPAGAVFRASGLLNDERIELHAGTLELEGVSQLAVSARIGRQPLALQNFALALAGGDLAILGPRWIAPLLAPALADRLRFAGRIGAGVELRDGRLVALDAVFDAAGISLSGATGGKGVAFGPLSGHLPWSATAPTTAQLRVDGGAWGALSLGGFDVQARLDGGRLAFEPVRIPLLDGALVLQGLGFERASAGWMGAGSVVVEPLSMTMLTEALGLPVMSGVLSASIPGLKVTPGEIALDGALVVSVFDGYLQATGLRISEPFGVASHLRADIEARHIDLAQLTDTFSFGSISGYVDADVRGLELVRWRPTAFDARLASSPGDYRRRISQRAVQNISALGGAGAIAALQRGLLGFFDTFGYRELGFHCVLSGGVCLMSGIDGDTRADGSFRIVRGGGIPALDVIGYNRRVDWGELVGRIQRVIEENVAPEMH